MTKLYNFAIHGLRWFFCTLMPFHVRNSERMPRSGGVILCSNHMSNTDPIRVAYSQKRQINFMAKAELFRFRPFGAVLRAIGAFPVERGKGDKNAINVAQEHLQSGDVLGIFIEGTRSRDGNLLPPKSGAVLIAHNCNVPILPCCITAKNGGLPKLFRRCIISYGELIRPEELRIQHGTPSELRAASKLVMSRIAALREESLKEFSSGKQENG